jgi:hypothetical protein
VTDLCTVDDLEDRLGRPLNPVEAARAPAAIADVSAVVLSKAPRVPLPPDTPDLVVGLTARIALQIALRDPDDTGIQGESLGGYSVSYRDIEDAFSEMDLDLLTPWRRSRIATVQIDPVTAVVIP